MSKSTCVRHSWPTYPLLLCVMHASLCCFCGPRIDSCCIAEDGGEVMVLWRTIESSFKVAALEVESCFDNGDGDSCLM